MKVVIRADASGYIGSGHIMRCLVLAEQLRGEGNDVEFVCRPQTGDLIQFIIAKGFVVHELATPSLLREPQHSSDYEAWLQVTWEQDANDFLSLVNYADWVIADHYALDYRWQRKVKLGCQCQLMVVDDLARKHDCDIILDQNLWRDSIYRYQSSHCRHVLIGPEYALLRPSFRQLRLSNNLQENQVLVFFGGADPTSECLKVSKALCLVGDLPFKVLIVAGYSNPDIDILKMIMENQPHEVCLFLDKFEESLASSKYVIGASGVSNWERFCLEIPTSIVSVADNQLSLSLYLAELNAVRFLGTGETTTKETYIKEFNRLSSVWAHLADESQTIIDVDGLGAKRVADYLFRLKQ